MTVYVLPIIISAAGALLSVVPILYFEETVSVAASSLSLLASIWILFMPGFTGTFLFIDGLSKLMLVMISAVYLTAVIFSVTYLKYIENPLFRKNVYFLLLNLFAFTMLLSVSVNSIGWIWVGIEATTVTSALLVAVENDETALEASWRYIIVVSIGLVISLLSVVLIYGAANNLLLSSLFLSHNPDNIRLLTLGTLMGIIGYGTKAGIFPMHTWLPDVHGKAPAPISAVFSAVLLPVALYAVERLMQIAPFPIIKNFALILGILTVATASILIGVQKRYKRMFAYSSMENMGMVLIGLSLGGYGFAGAVILMISHAFAKSGVFFLSGNLLSRYKTTLTGGINNVVKQMPATGYGLLFGSMSVTGLPPFGTFFGELMIIYALIKNYGIITAGVVAVFLILAFISLNYHVGKMLFSESGNSSFKRMERGRTAVIIPLINIILSFGVVFFIPQIISILQR